ncbi:hypothetical protein KP79_PYT16999 [Mizuhopecten yessoensis]|uniref:Uncharacterized protein n=1 Tax=Mizuhopecten yessoensis TaxID=6573 RepID=A0A210QSH4_MIZYE|nr:hypothetical protein KP79_PYT16999 [Mizuhopecten yessoensis]
MSAVSRFFDPALCLSGVSEEVLDDVVSYISRCCPGSEIECRQKVTGFRAYAKVQVRSNSQSFQSIGDVAQLAIKCRDSFPLVAMTEDCERGFSRQNLIKTDI